MRYLSNWRLWLAVFCIALGGAVIWFDKQSTESRDLVSVMNSAYADAFSLGITNKEAMTGVKFNHPPTFELIYSGNNEITGWFKTGISEDSQPSQATFIVSFPDTVVIGDPYLMISPTDVQRREGNIPDLGGSQTVDVDPPNPVVSGDSLFGGRGDLPKLMEEAKSRARHRRIIVGIPVDPIVQGFTFKMNAKRMLRHLGFGRKALHIQYMKPELLGLNKIQTTSGAIVGTEDAAGSTTSSTTADAPNQSSPPNIEVSLASSFSGQFEEVAPQAETSSRYSREWSTKGKQSMLIQADIVDNRTRFLITLLSNLLFTGIGFFLGSMEWARKWRKPPSIGDRA